MGIPKNYNVAIKALIVRNGKALALKDNSRFNGFDLPGGKIDEGEDIDKALKRELSEELGISDFKKGDLVHVYERFDYSKKDFGLILICFKVESDIRDIKLSDEHTGFEWLSLEDLQKLKDSDFRNLEIKKALEKALQ